MSGELDRAVQRFELRALYTVKALAEIAGVSPRVLRRLLGRHRVRFLMQGRARFVALSELRRAVPVLWESLVALEQLRHVARNKRVRSRGLGVLR